MTTFFIIYVVFALVILFTGRKETTYSERLGIAIVWPLLYVSGCMLFLVSKLVRN